MGEIIRKVVKPGDKPTQAQINEINEAYRHPIVYDEDCPEYTYEELMEMIKMTEERRKKQKKEPVTLRVSVSTLEKAKATGKGYTGFLSRLLDNAINNKDLVSRSL